jgi:RimJ/RimL family protein N-acetyltransferase
MIGPRLTSENVDLVAPKVRRDAPLSLAWLNGPAGHETQRLMGNVPGNTHDSDLAAEEDRVRKFLDDSQVYHWMIKTNGQVVGAIWLDLAKTDYLEAPSVHIMIGDPAVRGQGVASAAVTLVTGWAHMGVSDLVYSRALVDNLSSRRLLEGQGAVATGQEYQDNDGLRWQNYCFQRKVRA